MIYQKMLYSLRDISIIPAVTTTVKSRTECNPFTENLEGTIESGFLPLIAAPMSCVIPSEDYWKEYIKEGINCVIPRTISLNKRLELCKNVFTAFSLSEAQDILDGKYNFDKKTSYFILLDMANGHMTKQLEVGCELKTKFPKIKLMGGNIANPETYLEYNKHKFDYVRIGIGGGSGCLSSTQTGVHYPMASLLSDISDIKKGTAGTTTKIIADGGIGSFSEVIKCLALGADYVMMGKVFTKAAISGYNNIGDTIDYYGMSTKRAQTEMGNTKLKTSEGKQETITKEYTLSGWKENFIDYLRSAMSYCDSRDLETFKSVKCNIISSSSSDKINNK